MGCHQARQSRVANGCRPRSPALPAQVEVVFSVHNEASTLEHSVRALRRALDQAPFRAVVTITDTGSTDGTGLVASRLAANMRGVQALVLGRDDHAHALRMALANSRAEVVACIEATSPTVMADLQEVVRPVLAGDVDVASIAGAAGGSRGPRRSLPARVRRTLVRLRRDVAGRDRGPGVSAVRRARALEILPLIGDAGRSVPDELVAAADRRGLRVTEIPVHR